MAPQLPPLQPTLSPGQAGQCHVFGRAVAARGEAGRWERALSGSSPSPRAAGHRSVLLLFLHGWGGWVFSQMLALAHSLREKWDVSGGLCLFLLPLPLWVHGTRQPLPKARARGWEELPVPRRQQWLQGQQVRGLFGLCCAARSSDRPTSLPGQGWTEMPQPRWEPLVPRSPYVGCGPPGRSRAACPHPALPAQRCCGDFVALAQLQLQVSCFCPCLFWVQLVDGSSLFAGPGRGRLQFVDTSSSFQLQFSFVSSSFAAPFVSALVCFRSIIDGSSSFWVEFVHSSSSVLVHFSTCSSSFLLVQTTLAFDRVIHQSLSQPEYELSELYIV